MSCNLLIEAAAPTLERIRRDRERATSRPVRRFLDHVAQHLMDPGQRAGEIVRRAGTSSWSTDVRAAFRRATSRTPMGYVKECRLEIGAWLLRETRLSVGQIATSLGYAECTYFATAFSSWSGFTPARYRQAKKVGKLFAAAAASTLERIRRDRERAPEAVRAVLLYLERHLYDPDLNASQLLLAKDAEDHSAQAVRTFREAVSVSLTPYAYIEDCRLEVAGVLLWSTDLTVGAIANLVGYRTSGAFSNAFLRWSGFRPTAYRPAVSPAITYKEDRS